MNSAIRHISLSVIGALSILHAPSVFAQSPVFKLDKTTLSLDEGEEGAIALHPMERPNGNMAVVVTVSPSTGLGVVHSSPKDDETSGRIRFDQWGIGHAWNRWEGVTVTPAQDDDAIDNTFTVTFTGVKGPDNSGNNYEGVTATVTVTISEDDSESITVSNAAVDLTEGGSTGSFTVELDTAPTSSATLSVTSGDTGAATVSPATLTFTSENYDTAQTVTVTTIQDDDDTDESVAITVAVTGGYDNADAATKTISVDDDDGRIVVDPSPVSITEGNSADSFKVKLSRAPTSDTVIGVVSGDTDVVTLSPTSLTFTASNYDMEQMVTLLPVDDDDAQDDDATITLSVSSGGYSSADERVDITVVDDDEETIEVGSATVSLDEGDEVGKTFTVTLEAAPASGDATISVTSEDPGAVTASPATLTFTSENHDTPQMVTVKPVDDPDPSNEIVAITLAVADGSNDYDAADETVTVSVDDDESAPSGAIVLGGPASLNLTEGDDEGGVFTVKIEGLPDSEDTSDVEVSVVSNDPGAVSVDKDKLTFTHDDFDVPQSVKVVGIADDDHLHESVDIVLSGLNGITALRVAQPVTVRDIDKPDGKIIFDSNEDLEIAVGGSAHFTVRLSNQPNAKVTLSLVLNDDAITLTPASLDFSSKDWLEPKRVKVSVAPNIGLDERTITLHAEGGINIINNINNLDETEKPKKVEKIIRPIHTPPPTAKTIVVLPDEPLRIDEGSSGSFGVGLEYPDEESPPTENVVVRLSNANPDIALTPELLTFTPTRSANPSASWARWDETITVQVDALSDSDMQNDSDVIALSAAGFIVRNVSVEVKDTSGSDWPMKAWALALPPPTVPDDATLRVGCRQDTPCFVYLDCGAQSDDSTFQGVVPDPIPARGSTTFTAADIARHTGGVSWDGQGRLGCALRSAGTISAQVWTRSGDGVLVNNSAMIRSVPEGERHRADIESISSPDSPDKANIRIHCIAPVGDCTDTRFSCYDDHGSMYDFELGRIRSQIVRHLQSEELAMRILHRWNDLELSCEVRSDRPFTVQVLSRTGGGGALVNNSATGN